MSTHLGRSPCPLRDSSCLGREDLRLPRNIDTGAQARAVLRELLRRLDRPPDGPELARWKRRALIEWGVIAPPAVALRVLPADAPRDVLVVWSGISLLVAVRRLTEPDEMAFPLTRSFVPPWCGCEEPQARRALGWLDRNGFIWRLGRAMFVGRRPMTLWGSPRIASDEPVDGSSLRGPPDGKIVRRKCRWCGRMFKYPLITERAGRPDCRPQLLRRSSFRNRREAPVTTQTRARLRAAAKCSWRFASPRGTSNSSLRGSPNT